MNKLTGVHPELVKRIQKVVNAMLDLGFLMRITDGVRTTEEQQALYAQGRTKPGHKVTNCDGVLKKSNHQAKEDGYGHAVDCCFVDETGKPSWDARYPWHTYGACCEAVGLVWGGNWQSLHDLPHAELP